jgi:hypothetical protein
LSLEKSKLSRPWGEIIIVEVKKQREKTRNEILYKLAKKLKKKSINFCCTTI